MTDEAAKARLAAMSSKELLELHNRLSPRKTKRFASRAAGEKRVLALLTKRNGPEPRTVRPLGEDAPGKKGRPFAEFTVRLTEGKSKPRSEFLRAKILAHIKALPGQSAPISALSQQFGPKTRAAVQKLIAAKWLAKVAAS